MPNLFTYFASPPNFTVWHSHPGTQSRILITAGVDGDEYAGIAAAKQLTSSYQGNLPLTIIPLVNLAGFNQKTSYNPLDGRYPKHIFPGSRYGSSSSQLMAKVAQHARGVDLWIDLHGGATSEHLTPFIWAPQEYPVLSHLTGRALVEPSIAKGIPYLMLESGELGKVTPASVNTHLRWINQILNHLDAPAVPTWRPTYTKIHYAKNTNQSIPKNILWWSNSEVVTAS